MDFTDKLRLKEKAEENLYFAKVDRQLIEAIHEKQLRGEKALFKTQLKDEKEHTDQ